MSSSDPASYAFEQLEGSLHLPGAGPSGGPWERDRELAREEGREAGLAEAREVAAPALSALAEALDGLERLRLEMAERLERAALETALALAEQIVAGALEVQPERVLDVVRGSLRRLGEREQVTAIVSPEDLELVGGLVDELRAELGGIEHLTVVADRRIGRGGAVVRTQEGEIDAQIATQFERARAIVAQELAGA